MTKAERSILRFILPGALLTPRSLVLRAAVLAILFAVVHLAGLRAYGRLLPRLSPAIHCPDLPAEPATEAEVAREGLQTHVRPDGAAPGPRLAAMPIVCWLAAAMLERYRQESATGA